MTARYNRLVYDNHMLQHQCLHLESRISILESKIQVLESNIQPIIENPQKTPPSHSRKHRNKPTMFSINQYHPIVLPKFRENTSIPRDFDQYSSLTDNSDN